MTCKTITQNILNQRETLCEEIIFLLGNQQS